MKKNLARLATFKNLDLELLFCTDILKLNSLHYGYWEGGEEHTLENFRRAQERYTKTLVTLIPEEVKTILDVGCGIGDVSEALVNKGYVVTALSPDKNHQKYFDTYKNNLTFFKTKFESFHTDEKYDLILMSESQNYFDMNLGFKQCTAILKNGGYLLVSGSFRIYDSKEFQRITHIESEYIERATNYGFELLKSIDITENILPTAEFGGEIYKEYIAPSLNMLKYYVENSTPVRFKLLRFIFRKQLKQVLTLLMDWQGRADPILFRQKVRYMRLLFNFKGVK